MRTLLSIVGARPQFVKAAALDRAIAADKGLRHLLLHTGQHYDDAMSRIFFEELGIPAADIHLGVGSGRHGEQTARMIQGIEQALLEHRPDALILYGDTNSTLAGAVAAAKLHVPIAHVEAGLRSFNKAMPEEVNRVLCDHCSTWLFCPTATAVANLALEGFRTVEHPHPSPDSPSVCLSGDVMLDNSLHFAAIAAQRSKLLEALGLEPQGYFLATIHRDFNTDDPARLRTIITALTEASARHGLSVVIPLHPRTKARLSPLGLEEAVRAGLRVIPPAGYLDMIELERNARLIITDSGGVQKEAYFFHRPCVVLRPETEWVELIDHGQAVLADADPQRVAEAVSRFMEQGLPECPPLYGDGHAAEAIIKALA